MTKSTSRPLDYLVIGHVAKDLVDGGFTVGGTVSYASITARNLGLKVGIITSFAPDFDPRGALEGIEILCLPSPSTTVFQNLYRDGRREQFIRGHARPIRAQDIPPEWRRVPIVHLGPIAREVDESVVQLFSQSLIGITPQGWMREWDEKGRVFPRIWMGMEKVLPWARVLVFSEEDVARDEAIIQAYARVIEIVVVTQAARGATVYWRGQPRHFPARPAREVDPTGAGDVFAAAYLIKLHETGDPWQAARFANVVASFSVEGPGISGIPTRSQVERWLSLHG